MDTEEYMCCDGEDETVYQDITNNGRQRRKPVEERCSRQDETPASRRLSKVIDNMRALAAEADDIRSWEWVGALNGIQAELHQVSYDIQKDSANDRQEYLELKVWADNALSIIDDWKLAHENIQSTLELEFLKRREADETIATLRLAAERESTRFDQLNLVYSENTKKLRSRLVEAEIKIARMQTKLDESQMRERATNTDNEAVIEYLQKKLAEEVMKLARRNSEIADLRSRRQRHA